ncbi:MAG: DUF3784 domain-containing protein [Candidatus Latescibacteria bacterium]|nr:DUF3784 domain-containing protein [Candidatus Latescibacterota bacterium]
MVLGTIVCELIGLGLLVAGYFLAVKKATNLLTLLAGFDQLRINDEEAMARVTGPVLMGIGAYLCLAPFLADRFGPDRAFLPLIGLIFSGVIFVNIYCRVKDIF